MLSLSGSIIASWRNRELSAQQAYFYNYDVRGSVTNIVTSAGVTENGYFYDEFGNAQESGNTNFLNETTYTGSIKDDSTGLQYMNARFYDAKSGRFLSQDSYSGNAYDPWTQHLYSYCGNNPTNFTDPTGHFSESDLEGASAEMKRALRVMEREGVITKADLPNWIPKRSTKDSKDDLMNQLEGLKGNTYSSSDTAAAEAGQIIEKLTILCGNKIEFGVWGNEVGGSYFIRGIVLGDTQRPRIAFGSLPGNGVFTVHGHYESELAGVAEETGLYHSSWDFAAFGDTSANISTSYVVSAGKMERINMKALDQELYNHVNKYCYEGGSKPDYSSIKGYPQYNYKFGSYNEY